MIDEEYDATQDAARIARNNWRNWYRQIFPPAMGMPNQGGEELIFLQSNFPTLVSQAVITNLNKTEDGYLIRAVNSNLLAIIEQILAKRSLMYGIDPRKWEEIIAATYEASGLFDRITLTPRSGDGGRDLIAEKDGFGSVRIIESVKRYTPGHVVTAEEVRALAGVLSTDLKATKGVVSTTWEFAPTLREDKSIKPLLPTRLELVDGTDLLKRLREYTRPK